MKDNWLVIVNVFAASKQAGSVWKKAAAMLDDAGIAYNAKFTGGQDNAMELSRKAACSGYRRFIAVGGDGTIHDVLNGIARCVEEKSDLSISDFTLAVLPVGSGNDWVKSAGVPRDLNKAVKLIAEGKTGKQDVVRVCVLENTEDMSVVSDSYMANIGGIGLDARVCEIVNKKKEQGKRGRKLYVQALLYCIKHRVPVRAKVICDGVEVFNGKYLSMAFGIGKYSGGGMRQTPLAVMDDGLLDVTIIPDISMWTIARKAPRLFTGTFHKVDVLTQARCREVVVLPFGHADAEPAEVDGEVIGRVPVRLTVLPDQINIISSLN
jgi:YegS/Rv2252/BmrU family lipid kinase